MQIASGASFAPLKPLATVAEPAVRPAGVQNVPDDAARPVVSEPPMVEQAGAPQESASESASRKPEQSSLSSDASEDRLEEEAAIVRELQARDIEVRNHERAHQSVGGQLAGAPSYSFTKGPDGQRYAISGEVSIDVSEVSGDPSATYEKMARVRRAALAPAEPSAQDRQVAAMAAQKMNEAQADIAQQQREELSAEAEMREQRRDDLRSEIDAARAKESSAEKGDDDEESEFISVAERFAEYNARLRQINETLLRISSPAMTPPGGLLDEEA